MLEERDFPPTISTCLGVCDRSFLWIVNFELIVAMDDTSEGMFDLVNVKNDLALKLPSIAREQCTCGASAEDVVSELRIAFDVALQVEDIKVENLENSSLAANGCSDIISTMMSEKRQVLEHPKATSTVPLAHTVKCLCKCATSSLTDCISSASMDNNDNPQEGAFQMPAISLPVARKLVSAMKGGREKEGLAPRKLSVSWAPDVYDPPPSSVSHLPKRNNHSYRSSKKHSKGKQKSKNSQGSSSSRKKDKKHHHRKVSEKAEPSLRLTFAMDPVLATNTEKNLSTSNYNSTTMELLDFDNGEDCDNPDSNCGSSFLRKSCGTLHLSYAETT